MSESKYPEHDRMSAISEESQAIGTFIESEKHPYILAEWVTFEGHTTPTLVPISKSIQQVLADYFGIDMNKIETEKRQMLSEIRGNHG